ncbi:hypothetical protein DID88_006800 [Monilinia fructigena]|uniref:Mediator of RNA polymerase II transcription subunit 1 n=1 Tax=Monilinia fructigena TaxID=38457 RepID=A0A395IGY5_9HELO|nr:hypothetical protein DID88_006800 [Monilinia fructigena]
MATPTPGKYPGVAATPPVSTPFSTSHLAFSLLMGRVPLYLPPLRSRNPVLQACRIKDINMGIGYDSPSAALALGMGADPNKGRLSEAGLERLACRVGLECLWEDMMGSASNGRTLIIAGNALALDIEFANNIVQKVSLSFPDAPESVTKHEKTASDILLNDLRFEAGEGPLTKMLDRFAANLERLTMLDKLSVIPGLNCHEAVAGIFCSLDKLHSWELGRLKENDMLGMGDEEIMKAAMCIRSGIPVMHSRERLGLSLDYWQEKRRIPTKGKEQNRKTWSLLVEVAPLPSLVVGVYTPLRVSDKWISDDIQQADPVVDDLFQAAQLRAGERPNSGLVGARQHVLTN